MFWLGFIAAFGVATILVILWIKWDEWQQMKALDRENTEALLERLRAIEDAFWAEEKAKARGGKRG